MGFWRQTRVGGKGEAMRLIDGSSGKEVGRVAWHGV